MLGALFFVLCYGVQMIRPGGLVALDVECLLYLNVFAISGEVIIIPPV